MMPARYEHKARTVYGHEVWYFRYRRLEEGA